MRKRAKKGSVKRIDKFSVSEEIATMRKLRVEYPGAIYHVMNRGDRREAIFADEIDRKLFLERKVEKKGSVKRKGVKKGSVKSIDKYFGLSEDIAAMRKLRLEYPGAIYHVINRGDRREAIFADESDRKLFLETLSQACEKTDWQVHVLCLMNNHFHLVVETPKGNLVAGMKWFLGTYTSRFNRRHKEFGHLFSGRYKSLIVG